MQKDNQPKPYKNYAEFLGSVQKAMVERHVYCFGPDSRIWKLERGAKVSDVVKSYAMKKRTRISKTLVQAAKINGVSVLLDRELHNGDIVSLQL